MQTPIKISIIIPIYNELCYLKQCITSVLEQSLKSLELIIVSDGATKKSITFINKLLQSYPNSNIIFIILDKNIGPGGARNRGLLAAHGQYIVFLDADDYLLPNVLKDMYQNALDKNLDVLEVTYIVIPRFIVAPLKYMAKKQFFSGEQYIKAQQYCIETSCWSKIWKRKYLLDNSFFFPENLRQFEDVISIPGWLYNAKRVANTRKFFYVHREHSSSLSQENFSVKRYILVVQAIKMLEQELISNITYRKLIEFQIAFLLISELLLRGVFNNKISPKLRKRCDMATIRYKHIIRNHIWDKCLYLQKVKKKPLIWLGTWIGFSFLAQYLFFIKLLLKKYYNFCLRIQNKECSLLWKKFFSR